MAIKILSPKPILLLIVISYFENEKFRKLVNLYSRSYLEVNFFNQLNIIKLLRSKVTYR